MSEKRFTDTNDGIYDNQEKRLYKISAYEFFDCETDEVVDLLNEQQATISQLEKNFDDLTKWASEIAKRNVILDEQIGEQQSTIEAKNEYQRTLEAKIRRLKDRIKVLEK